MSNNDSFIDEVTEEVRRDKLFALFRRYGWIGVAAIVLIVAGAAWNEWSKSRAEAAAQTFGDAVLAAMAEADPAGRLAKLDAVAAGEAQQAVLGLLIAAEAAAAEDKPRAIEALQGIANDPALPQVYRDMAELKRVLVAGTEMDAGERDTLLAALAEPGRTFRPMAMEQQALVLAADGKADEAIALLKQVLQEPGVTPPLRRRASEVIVALGGDPSAG
ncbi:MAG: hypothetical protein RLZZ528_2235 [Pseudomonadota bacterium]